MLRRRRWGERRRRHGGGLEEPRLSFWGVGLRKRWDDAVLADQEDVRGPDRDDCEREQKTW